jgi:hypothetical protein
MTGIQFDESAKPSQGPWCFSYDPNNTNLPHAESGAIHGTYEEAKQEAPRYAGTLPYDFEGTIRVHPCTSPDEKAFISPR